MIELIIGAILGTIGSLVIAHFYYQKSSCELNKSIADLKNEIESLKIITKSLNEASGLILEDTELIRKHAVIGTTDDPEYPYK
ncbi:hypothetical protein [Nitrosomonas oligotropha]|uniref:Uncharacterized protein n=1 Tax=Nitrosomonas oligotropha TaxID=42354 RepID=A0A1H8UPS3_9PROT|nr:hypothetical protein [Nitrosomonas oligotropha]SDX46224.1 hypothetical protein SAMN05216300_13910 [Nitrosomonas oligotropha]SEP04588.1 hypothetical protein SAMN05216333_13810 [Nitrosomonas oligotropha]